MGDDFADDWSMQTVSIYAAADATTTARVVEERLGIVLTGNGEQGFSGADASGATLSVRSYGPESTSIYVRHTAVGHAIVEALSGPPFRLDFIQPRARAQDLRRRAGWERVVAALGEQGWRPWLRIDGPPVVLEGYLPTGEEFELKCQGDRCYFQVDENSVGWRCFELQHANAGVIEPDDAVRVLHELHARWLTR